ncbi:PCYCGC motif-containing (lipo)protein [Psychrobacillus sp.]|uniref:PCYCGC motif-containing (lipo)protein n=1 Tax=Psychrobacillus sp. TaxID=1871623 RepID=UPI0028BE67A1|nr:PCYCGC motif-containing (lipo)protein [Psychrobacillus sp.]
MKKILFLLLSSMLVLAACGEKKAEENHDDHPEHLPNGDLQEVTASTDVLPAFLDAQPEEMKIIYQASAKAHDILKWMPCYCGCGDSAGHESNFNCFVDEIKDSGEVVWDDHGTRCAACLETAVMSIKMVQEGKTLVEIRNAIDEAYKEGYATPTDTPMPS